MFNEIDIMDDKMREECGVFGIYAPGSNVAQLTYYGLYALQHRGQESAGIAVSNGKIIRGEKGMGLVSEVFHDTSKFDRLQGQAAVGHVRYSTSGSSLLVNAQPLLVRSRNGFLAIVHNGNLVNGRELRLELEDEGSIFQATTDSEVVAHLIARSGEKDVVDALKKSLPRLRGAYSLILMTPEKLVGLRDPHGIRPLSLGKTANGYVLASETCAFDTVGAEFVRDIEPGEMVVIDKDGVHAQRYTENKIHSLCAFEFIYFARPDSNLHGRNVHMVRKRLGRRLAEEHPVEADIVTGVPDSSLSAASGVAEQMGLPYELGFVKNRYIGRTFIQPSQEIRDLGVRLKLNPVRQIVEGKRVVMVDDSIVRGTTSTRIIEMLRNAGAKEVHVRISSPPVTSSCFYGIDTSTSGELIGAQMNVDEIAKYIGADSLGFLSEEGMLESMNLPVEGFCTACFSGRYPIEVACKKSGKLLEYEEDDGGCGGCGVHI
ncbi:amidophosphoribosyltransferase [Dethiobacter alkaliphilus]|uniref:Amidophosphoribosyltransferase n=1 Tax=Dethiobacter alkaliphilus AHT 1 TaxID=555088 RepID=C0GHA9_DETAL|nr:amidophosphoribosyltransferase [Dethiobacter alkaliphilus]EEG77411.1 amidophosphoribosyltransferase [Dethiobacter alkaliphilus AHT 1]